MKSFAETKTKAGFKLPAINEHRLSVGLLLLLLLCGAGYLIWLGIAAFLPEAVATKTESRSRIAERHLEDGELESAIQIFEEMLQDDPENGFAASRIARARQNEVEEIWRRYSTLSDNTGNARAASNLLAEEKRIFENVINGWSRLSDNGRYQRNAYQQMARLSGRRSMILGNSEDVEKSVAILDEMLQNGVTTPLGIGNTDDLKPLKSHPEYVRLIREEYKLKKEQSRNDLEKSGRSFIRRKPSRELWEANSN